jgi:hypothetical protein
MVQANLGKKQDPVSKITNTKSAGGVGQAPALQVWSPEYLKKKNYAFLSACRVVGPDTNENFCLDPKLLQGMALHDEWAW